MLERYVRSLVSVTKPGEEWVAKLGSVTQHPGYMYTIYLSIALNL